MFNLLVVATLSILSANAEPSVNELFGGFNGFAKKADFDQRLRTYMKDSGFLNARFMNYQWKERIEGRNFVTLKAQNYYKSIPVVGGMTLIHETKNGIDLVQTMKDFVLSTEPRISSDEAIKISKVHSDNKLLKLPELKVLPTQDRTGATLVYFVDTKTEGSHPGQTVVVDANNGKILAEISKAHTIAPIDIHTAEKQGYSIKELFELTLDTTSNKIVEKFSGCELKDLSTDKVEKLAPEDCFKLVYKFDPRANEACQLVYADGMPAFINPSKCKAEVKDSQTVGTLSPAAERAFTNSQKTLEYYLSKFNRNSFDNNNSTARSVVQVGVNFANAAWFSDAEFMIYGTGDAEFADFTSLVDVAGHELTHGVVSKTAQLMMMDESGALNEATADYFGKMIADDNTWKLAEGLFTADPKRALRDLRDPGSLKTRFLNEKGEKVSMPFPAKYSEKFQSFNDGCGEFNDRCYVHANSTIMSHAFYLMHQKVGQMRAENIVYTALTQFFTENTNFKEASEYCQKACEKLYDAATCTEVKSAFARVGL